MHVYDSEGTQCDPGHSGEFPSYQLHNIINLMIAQVKIVLREGGEEEEGRRGGEEEGRREGEEEKKKWEERNIHF